MRCFLNERGQRSNVLSPCDLLVDEEVPAGKPGTAEQRRHDEKREERSHGMALTLFWCRRLGELCADNPRLHHALRTRRSRRLAEIRQARSTKAGSNGHALVRCQYRRVVLDVRAQLRLRLRKYSQAAGSHRELIDPGRNKDLSTDACDWGWQKRRRRRQHRRQRLRRRGHKGRRRKGRRQAWRGVNNIEPHTKSITKCARGVGRRGRVERRCAQFSLVEWIRCHMVLSARTTRRLRISQTHSTVMPSTHTRTSPRLEPRRRDAAVR